MSKFEESFTEIDASLSSVDWVDENRPIEVHLTGEIDEESVDDFESNLRMAQMSGQEVIPIIINSTGGDCYCAHKVIDLLAACEQEIVTVVRGGAMSAAALIFSCGDRRVITKNSSIMLHSVSTGIHGGTTAEIRVDSEETDRLNSSMCELLDVNTGHRKGYFSKKMESNLDIFMDAEEAHKCNLASHIGDIKLTTQITVSTSLEIIKPKKRKRV